MHSNDRQSFHRDEWNVAHVCLGEGITGQRVCSGNWVAPSDSYSKNLARESMDKYSILQIAGEVNKGYLDLVIQ